MKFRMRTALLLSGPRFLVSRRNFVLGTANTALYFAGHPWMAARVPGGFLAMLPLTRRTHLIIGARL